MNKKKLLIGLLILFLFTIVKVDALSCDYEERAKLNNEVKNIKVNYEVKTKKIKMDNVPDALLGIETPETYLHEVDYFQINILNLTENEIVKVTNDKNGNAITIKYSDTTDGNYSFDWNDVMELSKLNFEILTSSKTGCSDESIKTLTLQLPRYNDYSSYVKCQDMPDYYLCQRYVSFDEMNFSDFYEKVEKEVKKQEEQKILDNMNIFEKTIKFIKEHKIAFIGGIVLVVVAGGTVIYIKIRRRRDDV